MSNNQLPNVALSKGTKYQVDLVNQIDKATKEMGQEFTQYGRECVINAMANLVTYCRTNDIKFELLDITMVKIALQNVGYTELNFNAYPAEAYFDIRKNGPTYAVTIKPQGAGNEKLTRRFGVNVKELKTCILVREGDEYTLPGFDGTKMTPFTWKPKSLDKKVVLVVYPLEKADGTYEYLMATRESIKPNLIAQIRQNNLYEFKKKNESTGRLDVDTKARDEFYEMVNNEFEKLTVDQILANPRWRAELTPTYTSGGSQEAMIIRKMKNNALKNYPREYSSDAVANAVKDMWEDRDDSVFQKEEAIDVDAVEKVEKEINEPVNENATQDFQVTEDGEVVTTDAPKAEEPKPAEEKPAEEPKSVPPTASADNGPNYEEDL